ncbi:MAG: hypothetical protein CL565_06895 [Alphaproteobacteria bacterium]|nr:hypothetical protein [Alphaproteobacteria bacterium]|tara:strand:+ start:301 stop:1062 length:762 start_codon:yes stop_codon:yes gene_type:complete
MLRRKLSFYFSKKWYIHPMICFTHKPAQEQGNVLFLILIAVALFAALSYAVSSSQSDGQNADQEKSTIAASTLVQEITLIKNTIQRMKILNNCTDEDITFVYDNDLDGDLDSDDKYWNLNLPSTECYLFHPDGGNLRFPIVDDNIGTGSEIIFTGFNWVDNVGTPASDLIAITTNITRAACDQINRELGAPTTNGEPVEEGSNVESSTFFGAYIQATGIDGMDGAYDGCFNGTNFGGTAVGDAYFYYSVLIAR